MIYVPFFHCVFSNIPLPMLPTLNFSLLLYFYQYFTLNQLSDFFPSIFPPCFLLFIQSRLLLVQFHLLPLFNVFIIQEWEREMVFWEQRSKEAKNWPSGKQTAFCSTCTSVSVRHSQMLSNTPPGPSFSPKFYRYLLHSYKNVSSCQNP